jgi:RNA polymerase sigma-70 factor, ECF subfamily
VFDYRPGPSPFSRVHKRMLLSETAKHAADSIVLRAYEDAREDVYYYVVALGLPPAQAQDVAQEVFLKLYVQLRDGQEIRNVRGWLFRVAHNEALKVKAKDKRYGEMAPGLEPPSQAIGAEKHMLEYESRRRLNEALADLSPQQRQVLQLRAAGLRYREIAETVGIGVSTVNEFMRRAVARLRKAVQ